MEDHNYTYAILEDINGKFDAVIEYVKDIPEIKQRLTNVESDVAQIKDDMTIVKGVIKEHSHDIAELKQR